MRTVTRVIIAALLVLPAAAEAQPPPESSGVAFPFTTRNWIDFGGRLTDIDGEQARFQRYRDLREGGVFDAFRWTRETTSWAFDAGADHVGRRDQRYVAGYDRFGKLKASFTWDQIPLFISRDTATLYTTPSPGVLRIADSIQQGIQNRALTIRDVGSQAVGFETRNRRDTARFDLSATPTEALELTFKLSTAHRDGTMPWGASFGFNHAVEVAAPIDTRTTDLNAGAEWVRGRGLIRVAYDGSWFDNEIQTLVWDNPIRFTDQTYASAYVAGDGTSQGRSALWPSNTLHTVSTFGSLKLPARSRASAYFALSGSRQNEAILPHTINTAIPTIPLERGSADADFRTIATNLTFTTRPNRYFALDARYRLHDLENRTPFFPVEEYVRLDQVVEDLGAEGPEHYSVQRQSVDVDATFSPVAFTGIKVGYGRAAGNRTARHFLSTVEDTFRTSVDYTGNQYVTVRGLYEHAVRDGSDFDEEFLDVVGEQPGMRHYDIANRNRDRITALVTVMPVGTLGVTASIAAGEDDYPDSEFGLANNDHRVYSLSFDVNPREDAQFGAAYSYERYTWLGRSRNAAPGAQFTDPTRNWSTDGDDKVHNVGGYVDLLRLFPRTEIRANYDYNHSRSVYTYGLAPNTTLTAVQPLPRIFNELHGTTVDTRYFIRENVALGFVYLFEKYDVDDFALEGGIESSIALPQVQPGEPLVPTTGILLNYIYRPYTAHSAWVRLTYLW